MNLLKPAIVAMLVLSTSYPTLASGPGPEEAVSDVLDGYVKQDYRAAMAHADARELRSLADIGKPVFVDRPGDTPNALRVAFFGPELSNKELLAMSDADFAAAVAAAYSKVQAARSHTTPARVLSYRVLGHVEEAPDLCHVVVRETTAQGTMTLTSVRAYTVRQTQGAWGMLLDAGAMAVMRSVRQQYDEDNAIQASAPPPPAVPSAAPQH